MAKTADEGGTATAVAPQPKRKFMVSLDLPVLKNTKGNPTQYAPPPYVVDARDEAEARVEYLRCRGFDREDNSKWLRETWGLSDTDPLPFVVEAY